MAADAVYMDPIRIKKEAPRLGVTKRCRATVSMHSVAETASMVVFRHWHIQMKILWVDFNPN